MHNMFLSFSASASLPLGVGLWRVDGGLKPGNVC